MVRKHSLWTYSLCAGALLWLGSPAPTSRAEDAPAAPPKGPAKPLSCQVSGETPVAADAMVYDRGSGGYAIAKLTGAKLPITVTHVPNPSNGRIGISTSTGDNALRIDGWVDKSTVRFFAVRDLELVANSVWITKGQELKVTGATSTDFMVEHKVIGSNEPALSTNVPCDGATLIWAPPDPADPPAKARNYQMKSDVLELFDGPRGALVYTLKLDENARKVFWSTEQRGNFVRVMSRSDITIDAWAKASELTALRHAELFDHSAVAPRPFPERKLEVQDPPAVVVVDKEMPIHMKPGNSPTPIGWAEVGARIYPMERSGDWTNIMPESLGVLPPEGGGFWVRTAGLPKK
jgi:hypothetical protein